MDHLTIFTVAKVVGEEPDEEATDGDDADDGKDTSSKGMDQFCAVSGMILVIGLALFFWFGKKRDGSEGPKTPRGGGSRKGPPRRAFGKGGEADEDEGE